MPQGKWPKCSAEHRAPEKTAAVPVCKVLVKPGLAFMRWAPDLQAPKGSKHHGLFFIRPRRSCCRGPYHRCWRQSQCAGKQAHTQAQDTFTNVYVRSRTSSAHDHSTKTPGSGVCLRWCWNFLNRSFDTRPRTGWTNCQTMGWYFRSFASVFGRFGVRLSGGSYQDHVNWNSAEELQTLYVVIRCVVSMFSAIAHATHVNLTAWHKTWLVHRAKITKQINRTHLALCEGVPMARQAKMIGLNGGSVII